MAFRDRIGATIQRRRVDGEVWERSARSFHPNLCYIGGPDITSESGPKPVHRGAAEVIRYEELIAAGSEAEAKKRGVMRTEGKLYVVQDGDVLHILFNV